MTVLLSKKKDLPVEKILPLVPIRNLVAFPDTELQLIFGRPKSTLALSRAFGGNKEVLVVSQKDSGVDDPATADLYQVGVLCRVEHVVQIDGTVHAIFRGLQRARIVRIVSQEPFVQVAFELLPAIGENDPELKILADHLYREVKKAFSLGKTFDPGVLVRLNTGVRLSEMLHQVAFSLDASVVEKQAILESLSLKDQVKLVLEKLAHEISVLLLEQKLEKRTKAKFDKQMKRTVLEERKKTIEKELLGLGVKSDEGEIKELRQKLEKAGLKGEAKKKADYEINRLAQMPGFAPEASYIRTYLEWLADLPWSKTSSSKVDFKKSKTVLNQEHYALKHVKERILEHLAVMKLRSKLKKKNGDETVNILCFVGPPGVGKTSIGRSIAKALGREFVRTSLGGIRDEAEIRGHRRTYVGAMPGRIIQGIKSAGTKNPVFMLDEVDKIGNDFRGDPSAALLEALDPEQNKGFSDHYLEVPFDLSGVFFILTGNVLDTIPPALLDRLEVIRFTGYTSEEKFQIAQKYLVPKQLEKNGLKKKDLVFSQAVTRQIVESYTREAGVRGLERTIASVCRKVARKVAEGKKFEARLTAASLEKLLGPEQFRPVLKGEKDVVGVSTGMAWTQAGGKILFIEVALMPGKGRVTLTGQLGNVMKESCQAAISYTRSNWKKLGIKNKDFFQKTDFHIHVPEGAVQKDGPSAGTAITTALVSALTGVPARKDVAMTGEITLRGRVLDIGGVKEKVLAAHQAGIETVILPNGNKKDLIDVPGKIKKELKFVFADRLDEVLSTALKKK
ncbi:MAG: endopeptidase La [Patescibacteria group bacterium]